VKGLNPKTRIFELSCKTSVGIEDWCNWLLQEVEAYLLQVKSA